MKGKMKFKSTVLGVGISVAVCAGAKTLTVDASGNGEFRTIGAAMKAVEKGDVVLVQPGVYREEVRIPVGGLSPECPTVLRSAVRGAAVVKGSDVWTNAWTNLGKSRNCWTSPIDFSRFAEPTNAPYRRTISVGPRDASRLARPVTNETVTLDTYCPRTLGQVFLDGAEMTEVVTVRELKAAPDTWMVSPDGKSVWLHPAETRPEPAKCLVEWSVRNRCIGAGRRGLRFVTVDGFACEHCANQGPFPQIGAIDIRTGHDWVVEHCTVRHAKTIGISCGSETWAGESIPDVPAENRRLMIAGGNVIRFNTVTDCGVSGIAAWNPNGLRIYGNAVERNNAGNYGQPERYWDETAGIKIHGAPVVVANNLVRDNDGHGVWFDTGFTNTRCTGNLIVNNRRSGVMFESCFGHALVDNNVIANTRPDGALYYGGDGIYSHNGSGVTVAHNLIALNYGAGVRFRTIWGKVGGRDYNTTSNRYVNNVFYANGHGELMVALTNRFSFGTQSSGNLYLVESGWHDGLARLPFRFANYNVQGGMSNVWERCRASGGAQMPFGEWQALGNPVDLDCWRKVQGLDLDSRVYRSTDAFALASRELSARFLFPKEAEDFRVPAIAGISCDFFGQAYPSPGTPVRPGPFLDFACGELVHRAVAPVVPPAPPRFLK